MRIKCSKFDVSLSRTNLNTRTMFICHWVHPSIINIGLLHNYVKAQDVMHISSVCNIEINIANIYFIGNVDRNVKNATTIREENEYTYNVRLSALLEYAKLNKLKSNKSHLPNWF